MVHDLFNDVSISLSMSLNRRITSIRAGTIWKDAVMVKLPGANEEYFDSPSKG
jgi:hypothetical protein